MTGVLALAVTTAFTPVSDTDGFYQVNLEKSKVNWVGSKVTGSTHEGTVMLKEGGISISNGKIASGKFTIDMTSINVTDLDGGMKKKLEAHLHNDDFFSTDKFKTANLVIKEVKGDNITADLTIKNITHPVTFPAKVVFTDGKMTATAEIKVDRTKYEVRYGSDSFFDNLGDKAIDDTIVFNVNLTATAS